MRGFLARVRGFIGAGVPSLGLGLPKHPLVSPCFAVRFDEATIIEMGSESATSFDVCFGQATVIDVLATSCQCGD